MECIEAIDVMGEAVEDSLESPILESFAAHLDECVPCRNYYHQLRVTRRALGALPRESRPSTLSDLVREFRQTFRKKDTPQ